MLNESYIMPNLPAKMKMSMHLKCPSLRILDPTFFPLFLHYFLIVVSYITAAVLRGSF